MFGPIFTQRLLLPMVQQQAKYAFAVNVGILGATAAFIAACLGESLDKDQRKPMNWCGPQSPPQIAAAAAAAWLPRVAPVLHLPTVEPLRLALRARTGRRPTRSRSSRC